eukprot:jgi/Bigna1/131767/aug1.15_g6475
MELTKQPYFVQVHLIEARGVAGLDSNHTSDVHCEVAIGPTSGMKRTTFTKYETVDMVFNETYVFEGVMLTDDEWKREKVAFTLYNRNSFVPNKSIGEIEFSLSNVYRQKNHEYFRKWVPVTLPESPGKENGFLRISVHVLKRGDPAPARNKLELLQSEAVENSEKLGFSDPKVEQKVFLLNCLIYRGEDIKATHSKSLNPFVSIRFNGNTCQTARMASLSAPLWNRKIEMPYHLPLTSDAIEIQVWNHNRITPDTLIGSKTISYYEEGLTHRPWGPRWINLYSSYYKSPSTTLYGSLLDVISGGEHIGQDEYVGRLLVRLSTKSVQSFLNPRLRSIPTAPAAEPEGEMYSLDVAVLSATEIPVTGGKLFVEVTFGPKRESSDYILGMDGTFHWNQVLKSIEFFGTEQIDQIAFERIPAANLLDSTSQRLYMVNGEPLPDQGETWKPQWRSLKNVRYEESKSHIVAGFLLCWIGFGIKDHRPSEDKMKHKITLPRLQKYTLRFYLHNGTNIPAGSQSGQSNPFVVIRFAGRTRVSKVKRATRYPVFYQLLEITGVQFEPSFAPSLQVLVYHETGSSFAPHRLLGRCDIKCDNLISGAKRNIFEKIFTNRGRLPSIMRYPIKLSTENSLHIFDYDEMSLTAQVELFEEELKGSVPGLLAGWGDSKQGLIKHIGALNVTSFVVRMDLVGVFEIDRSLSKPALRMRFGEDFVPKDSTTKPENSFTHALTIDKTGNAKVMLDFQFNNVCAPRCDLHAVALHLELLSAGQCIASCALPLAEIIGGQVMRPRLYPYKETISPDEVLEEIEEAEMQKQREMEFEYRRQSAREKIVGEDVAAGFSTLSDNDLELGEKISLEENFISGNLRISATYGISGLNLVQENADESPDTKHNFDYTDVPKGSQQEQVSSVDDNSEYFYVLQLYSGRSVGHSRDVMKKKISRNWDKKSASHPQEKSGVVKCFLRAAPNAKEIDEARGTREDSLNSMKRTLESFEKVYRTQYIIRVYVYRAVHIAPSKTLLNDPGDASWGCNPYLNICNGSEPEHSFSSREQIKERCLDLNPEFYQACGIVVKFICKERLFDKPFDTTERIGLLDRFVGECTVNTELRALKGFAKGHQEWYTLFHPEYATSRGKILLRTDVLTEDEARIFKAEELSGPQYTDYEFRLEKDLNNDVDQKLRVTINFSGAPGRDSIKDTDVAWYAAGGRAEWNYRMVFPVKLPMNPEHARVKFSLWDENLVGSAENVGEAVLNLAPFFGRTLQGVRLGQLYVEASIVTKVFAEEHPVGEAQNEPNRLPFLPNPKRNAPPWALGSRALEAFANYRNTIFCIVTVILIAAICIPIVAVAIFATTQT